ncbi:thioredoxin-like protein [Mrakia frigida]|uniref:Plp1p n=1 Tax=Mrakia frigida TaxID=29902 RepID=UPI003FCC1936
MSEDLIDTAPRTAPSVLPRREVDLEDDNDSDKSDGELFEELEEDEEGFDWGGFREKRMEQLKEDNLRIEMQKLDLHGRYTEIKIEKELIITSSKESYVVIHFFHPDFRRCHIMHRHLERIAPNHPKTLFLKADVANVPWLVEKMQIKVLPCVLCFVGGSAKDKIVGFEGLTMVEGKEDDFKSGALENRLKESGVIPAPGAVPPNQQAASFNFTNSTFASGGGSGSGRRGIRQGVASRGRGSDGDDDDRSD